MIISPSKLFSTGLLSLAFLFSNSVFAAVEAVITAPEQASVGLVSNINGLKSHGVNLLYSWEVDVNGVITTYNTATISYLFPEGEYSIKLTVEEQDQANLGTKASVVKIITILPVNKPTAPFSSLVIKDGVNIIDPKTQNLVVGKPYTFESTTNFSDIASSNNVWDFGDSINIGNQGQMPVFESGSGYTAAGANTEKTTTTHTFTGPSGNKPFIITLASQVNFGDAGLRALTGTATMAVTVTGKVAQNTTPIAERYKNECSDCHGMVIPGVTPTAPEQVINNKHSNLAGRLLPKTIQVPGGLSVTLNPITEQRIADAYTSVVRVPPSDLRPAKYMDGIRPRLTIAARDAKLMETYLNGLVAFIGDRTPEQIYLDQCSGCHGAGTGGYANDITGLATTAAEWEKLILKLIDPSTGVNDMKSITIRSVDLTKLAILLANTQLGVNVIPKPTDGNALYTMYCTYCHGANGAGGPLSTNEPIKGVGISVDKIIEEIDESDGANGMEKLKGKLTLDEIILIQKTL